MACYSKNDRNSGPAPASKPSWDAKCSSLSRGFGPRVPKISTVCHSMSPKKRMVSMGKSTINGNTWYIFHCHVSLPTNHSQPTPSTSGCRHSRCVVNPAPSVEFLETNSHSMPSPIPQWVKNLCQIITAMGCYGCVQKLGNHPNHGMR